MTKNPPPQNQRIIEALAITAEICGTQWSPAAAKAVLLQLQVYTDRQVIDALQRCQVEITGRLSLAAIIERIDDGRPSADEAWAVVGTNDEARTLVTTHEAMEACGLVRDLMRDDMIAARRAFIDAYRRITADNRAAGKAPMWYASLGHDKTGWRAPLLDGVERGRLPAEYVADLLGEPITTDLALPPPAADPRMLQLASNLAEQKALPPGPMDAANLAAERRDREIRRQVAELGAQLAETSDDTERRALLEQIHALTVCRAAAQEEQVR